MGHRCWARTGPQACRAGLPFKPRHPGNCRASPKRLWAPAMHSTAGPQAAHPWEKALGKGGPVPRLDCALPTAGSLGSAQGLCGLEAHPDTRQCRVKRNHAGRHFRRWAFPEKGTRRLAGRGLGLRPGVSGHIGTGRARAVPWGRTRVGAAAARGCINGGVVSTRGEASVLPLVLAWRCILSDDILEGL